jgi:protein-S-isoprenylcysteine O-methyltransferase
MTFDAQPSAPDKLRASVPECGGPPPLLTSISRQARPGTTMRLPLSRLTTPVQRDLVHLQHSNFVTLRLPEILGPLWGASEFVLALARRSKSDATSKDRHSLGLIWLVVLSAIALGVVAAYQLPQCKLPRPNFVLEIGCALYALGLALRWYSIIHLGRFFTANVAIAADHRLIDSGPYHFVRHPSYTGMLMAVFGFALTFANWASLLIIFAPTCAVQLWRIYIEEEALIGALGEEYRGYMRRTRCLIPLIY